MAEVISVGIPVVNFNPLYALPPGGGGRAAGDGSKHAPKAGVRSLTAIKSLLSSSPCQ